METLFDSEDDAGYSDACEYEWELDQVDLLLRSDPNWETWLDYIEEQNSHVH